MGASLWETNQPVFAYIVYCWSLDLGGGLCVRGLHYTGTHVMTTGLGGLALVGT